MDFLDILLEAPGDNSKPKPRTLKVTPKQTQSDTTDYTADNTDTPDANEPDDDTTTDAPADDATDDSPTDYTEEEDESNPDEDGADPDDPPADDDESTDYTADDSAPTDDDDDSSSDDTSTDDTTGDDSTEEDPEEANEKENMRILLEDFTNLFHLVKNSLIKLTNIDKSNIVINKIVTQISMNLNTLKKQLFDYITFDYSKGKYVTNLYKYNYFLEAFKINVEMLKKISIFIPN